MHDIWIHIGHKYLSTSMVIDHTEVLELQRRYSFKQEQLQRRVTQLC